MIGVKTNSMEERRNDNKPSLGIVEVVNPEDKAEVVKEGKETVLHNS